MPDARIRPKLDREFDIPASRLLEQLTRALQQEGCPCAGRVFQCQVEIVIRPPLRHVWSPWFSGRVESAGGSERSRIRGRFGPRPGLWTGILAGYAILTFAGFVFSMLGIAQWLAEEPTSGFTGTFVCLGGTISLYLSGWAGRRASREHRRWIRALFDCSAGGNAELQCDGSSRCAICPRWQAKGRNHL